MLITVLFVEPIKYALPTLALVVPIAVEFVVLGSALFVAEATTNNGTVPCAAPA